MNTIIILLMLLVTTPAFAESICITDPPAPDDQFMQQLCHDILVVAPAIERERNRLWREIDAGHLPTPLNTPQARTTDKRIILYPPDPEAQACLDHFPSASRESAAAIRCYDLLEMTAPGYWATQYAATHPETQACRDTPPTLSNPDATSRCVILLDEERIIMAHRLDNLRIKTAFCKAKIQDRVAQKARQPIDMQRWAEQRLIEYDLAEERHRRFERNLEQDLDREFNAPVMMLPPPISCTSYALGMFVNTDCY